ncbi:MAG: WD40 repeat domain-containing protein [Chloroflexi bacterium]|nr:WD40 repeat domain-containing protein [Chloroflexota bacterium]
MRHVIFFLIAIVFFLPVNSHAQEPGQPITPDNVDQLQLVQTLGRGKVIDAQWAPDGGWFGVLTSRGVWLYPKDDVVSDPIRIGNDSRFMSAFVFHPTESQIITGYADGLIAVWSFPDGELLDEWASDLINIHEIAISPDGTRLATSENNYDKWLQTESAVVLWDFEAREEIWRIANVPEPSGLVFSEDRLFTNFYSISDGGYESIVQSWDPYSIEPIPTDVDLAACGLEISADRTMLLGVGGCAYFWFRQIDLASDTVLSIPLNRFFEDGGTVTADADGLLVIDAGEAWWYKWGDEEATLIDIYQRRINVISVDGVTGRFAVIDNDGYIYHYRSTTSGLDTVVNDFSNGIQKILVSRDGNTIYVLEGNVVYQHSELRHAADFHVLDRSSDSITYNLPLNNLVTFATSDDERWLVLGDTSANVYLLDLYTGEQVELAPIQWRKDKREVY